MSEVPKSEWVDWNSTKVLQKAAIVDEAGNLLAIKRVETGPASRLGKWDLPGGSIEQSDIEMGGKPHEIAIRREVIEETGLAALAIEATFVDSWTFERSPGLILGIAIGYKVTVGDVKPSVQLSDEHTQYIWGTRKEVLALDFGDDGGLHSSIIRAA
jgi:8-oxo-dGTP pyrophosphatase MutT (NUDIX family)